MRSLVMAAVCLSFSAALALPAEAQGHVPRKSRAERKVEDVNRNLRLEQRQQRFEQQYQIDNNQLRQGIDRQRTLSNPTPPAGIRTCPSGSVGC